MKAREFLALAAILAGGFAVRSLATLFGYWPTIDTGTVGLMACDILDGARPTYFYGQAYLGALEAYVAAGFAALFGPSPYTVNLAPILFSLGWATAAWGVVRSLYGPAAGLAAAALLAFAPWHVLWYSMATYGGYPEAWFLGTCAIAAALHIVRQPDQARAAAYLALGLSTGLGFWVNPQSLMFAGVGWLILAPRVLARPRQSLPGAALAGACALAFILPTLSQAGDPSNPQLMAWSLDPADWERRFREFVRPGLQTLIWSRTPVGPWWNAAVGASLALGAGAAVTAVARARDRRERLLRCAPLAVVVVSLVLSLPHSMADERAPRYLIPLWSGLACWIFAMPIGVPVPGIARTARVALIAWLLAQGFGIGYQVHRRHPDQVTTYRYRDQIVAASAALGHPYTYLVNGAIWGHHSQPWNFHGLGQTRFLSSFDERCIHTQVAAEAADRYALACKPELADKTAHTLDALQATYRTTPTDSLVFFHDITPAATPQTALRPDTIVWIDGADAGTLSDRRWDTAVNWSPSNTLRITFNQPVELTGCLLFSPDPIGDGLPQSLDLEVSSDGQTFHPAASIEGQFNAAYRAGNRVFLKGYFPALEMIFAPVRVVAVQLRAASPHPITINELFLFAPASEPADLNLRVEQCQERLDALGIRFVFADRYQSARLQEAAPPDSPPVALPPYNPKNPASSISRKFSPSPDTGILLEHRFADDAVQLLHDLYGPDIIAHRETLGGYDLLALNPSPADRALYWNGLTVLAGPAESSTPRPEHHP